jgi:hypothetical protein
LAVAKANEWSVEDQARKLPGRTTETPFEMLNKLLVSSLRSLVLIIRTCGTEEWDLVYIPSVSSRLEEFPFLYLCKKSSDDCVVRGFSSIDSLQSKEGIKVLP